MKKRILIVNNNMHIGGVQKALCNLLSAADTELDITLLLFYPCGSYIKEIPENVNVISVKSDLKYLGMTKDDVKGCPVAFIKRSFYAGITRIFGRSFALKIMGCFQKKLSGYDTAISYLHNGGNKVFYGGCNDFVLNHVDAAKKITFLHCDYGKCGANTPENAEQYSKFDVIAACSDGCKASFVNCLPELEDKCITVHNCHNYQRLDEYAAVASLKLSNDKINILTVARMGREKGILRSLNVIAKLNVDHKKKIRYYLIGDGIEMNDVKAFIEDNGLSEIVECLGEKENPYGYMNSADLLLIPSYSEAAPLVIGEAAYFATPVLSTETSSAHEMIEDTGYGWVCGNSEEELLVKLSELIDHSELISDKKEKFCKYSFSNTLAKKEFYGIL